MFITFSQQIIGNRLLVVIMGRQKNNLSFKFKFVIKKIQIQIQIQIKNIYLINIFTIFTTYDLL